MTENKLDNNHLNINNQSGQGAGGYLINNHTPSHVQRATTGCSYDGNPVHPLFIKIKYMRLSQPNETVQTKHL